MSWVLDAEAPCLQLEAARGAVAALRVTPLTSSLAECSHFHYLHAGERTLCKPLQKDSEAQGINCKVWKQPLCKRLGCNVPQLEPKLISVFPSGKLTRLDIVSDSNGVDLPTRCKPLLHIHKFTTEIFICNLSVY